MYTYMYMVPGISISIYTYVYMIYRLTASMW